ncbi:PREDICTED: lysozyme C-like [Gekko japonicus]|uniref:lysozyme n=1 Tax=Gekko japonicus TaxID=146911 RepID=A0ABM1LD17_GEKJA|nr:PREDICTED: lysozyme C-like [Gekko japonicus]
MKALLPRPVFLLASFLVAVQAKIYERCELVKKLNDHGLDGYQGYSLANWVCLAFFESSFDTRAVGHKKDGTSDYGIFQINSGWWCADEDSASDNLCDIDCKELLNPDIEKDIRCAKRIVEDPQGMDAW